MRRAGCEPAPQGGDYELTPEGASALESLGLDVARRARTRRRFACACLDWSERRPHLGGALGAACLQLSLRRGWVRQALDGRELALTPKAAARDARASFGRGLSGESRRYWNATSAKLRSLRLCSRSSLPRPQDLDRAHADAQVLVDALAVELVGHAGQLDLAVQRLVAHAQQGAVGHAEAEAVGRDGGAFHVERHRAALAEAALRLVAGQQLPVAVVGAGHGAGAHDRLEVGALACR